MDLALDINGDLAITNGDIVKVISVDAIAQQTMIALRMFLGEWYRDPTQGMPYFDRVFEKGVRSNVLEGLFRRACLAVPGVSSVENIRLTFDRAQRRLVVQDLRLLSDDGDIVEFPAFVVG